MVTLRMDGDVRCLAPAEYHRLPGDAQMTNRSPRGHSVPSEIPLPTRNPTRRQARPRGVMPYSAGLRKVRRAPLSVGRGCEWGTRAGWPGDERGRAARLAAVPPSAAPFRRGGAASEVGAGGRTPVEAAGRLAPPPFPPAPARPAPPHQPPPPPPSPLSSPPSPPAHATPRVTSLPPCGRGGEMGVAAGGGEEMTLNPAVAATTAVPSDSYRRRRRRRRRCCRLRRPPPLPSWQTGTRGAPTRCRCQYRHRGRPSWRGRRGTDAAAGGGRA